MLTYLRTPPALVCLLSVGLVLGLSGSAPARSVRSRVGRTAGVATAHRAMAHGRLAPAPPRSQDASTAGAALTEGSGSRRPGSLTIPNIRDGAFSRFFSPHSFWNEPLSANAPRDPDSAGMVAKLMTYVKAQLAAKNGPWLNASHDGVAIVTVPANQPTVRVTLVNHSPDPALSAAWSAVPLPSSAQPSNGDCDLAVWQPATDRLWEFFELAHTSSGWQADWGGAMHNVSSNPGVYTAAAWPGAKSWWGVTAASLSIVGGAITVNDLAAGQIDHALALVVPDTRRGWYASPAERDDGQSTSRDSLPEGAHLRIDPSLNLANLNMPPLTRMIAEAAQRYGIIVRDTSPIVAFVGQDPTGNPAAQSVYVSAYGGLDAWQLMSYFPWSHLQVLRMDRHRGS